MTRIAAIAGVFVAMAVALSVASAGPAIAPPIQGDANCDSVVGPADALSVLDEMAGVPLPSGGCQAGTADTDCDGDQDGDDVLAILLFVAQQPAATAQSDGCAPIGSPIETTPTPSELSTPAPSFTTTPTASPLPTDSPSPTPTATATPGITPTPTATPVPTLGPCGTQTSSAAAERVPAGAPLQDNYTFKLLPATADIERLTSLATVPNEPGFALITTEDGQIFKICLTESGRDRVANFTGFVRDKNGTNDTDEGMTSLAFDPLNPSIVYIVYSYPKTGPYLTPDASPVSNTIRTRVSRFHIVNGAIDRNSEKVILEIYQPSSIHNVDGLVFGPDGMLYIGSGDGGEDRTKGQTLDDLWGAVLRIDVHSGNPYAIPTDNPFVDGTGGNADEIWAYGLRNPWRFTFDNGQMWLADVGSSTYEEVDIGEAGANYGWPVMEGYECFPGVAGTTITPGPTCNPAGYATPRAAYSHDTDGCAVMGGYVYRGSEMPELDGYYIYEDHCSGRI